MGVPYLTLDPSTGEAVAQYPDGSVVPIAQQPAPQMMAPAEGATDGGYSPQGSSGSGEQAGQDLWFAGGGTGAEGTAGANGANGSDGGGGYDSTQGSSYRGGGSYGHSSGYGQNSYDYQDDSGDIPEPPGFGFDGDFGSALGHALDGQMGGAGGGPVRSDRSLTLPSSGAQHQDWGGQGATPGGGGSGGLPSAADRLAAARGRIRSALGAAGLGSSSSSSSYSSSTPSSGGVKQPHDLHHGYAKGMDPSQAAGITLRPTTLLPRVFPHLTPADPTYGHLAAIPAGAMGQILGNGKVQSTVNKTGDVYHDAGMTGHLPSTDKLLKDFTKGKGLETMFQGVKAHGNDYPSTIAPGYVYGQEPLPLGQATAEAGTLLDATLYGEPTTVQEKYGSTGWGGYMLDRWANKAANKPAGHGKPVYRYLGRHLFR